MATTSEMKDVLDAWNKLHDAASDVVKYDQIWLAALEEYFDVASDLEQSSPKSIVKDKAHWLGQCLGERLLTEGDDSQKHLEAVRMTLDEVTFLRFADRKLDGRISKIDSASEDFRDEVSNALKETEAYRLITLDSYGVLKAISTQDTNLADDDDFKNIITDDEFKNITKFGDNATFAREGGTIDGKTVNGLYKVLRNALGKIGRQPAEAELPGVGEATGAELLLEKGTYRQDRVFLALMQPGTDEYESTEMLLAGQSFDLDSDQIASLIASWGEVITSAASTIAPALDQTDGGKSKTGLPLLFLLHNILERLYELLETNVTRTKVDVLALDI